MAGGRPSKYKKKYCKEIIEMSKTGKLPITWSQEFEVDRSTLTEWSKVHPEFSVAWTKAKQICENFWHDKLCDAENAFELNKMKTILNLAFHVTETQKIEAQQKIDATVENKVTVDFADRDEC